MWFDPVAVLEAKKRLTQGTVDRDTLAIAHLPLAVSMGRKLARHMQASQWVEDWIQAASLTLVDAAASYLERPATTPFEQYAASAIYRRLSDLLRQQAIVAIPPTTFKQLPAYQRLFAEAAEHGAPKDEEAAAALRIPVWRVKAIREAWKALREDPVPLDAPLQGRNEGDAPTVADAVIDQGVDVEGEALAAIEQEERQELWRAVADLKPLDRVVLGLNLGIATFDEATIGEIARAEGPAGVSLQHRVRGRLAALFREGQRDARRLGFLPEDATGRQLPGRRMVNQVSGRRGSARRKSPRRHPNLRRGAAGV